MSKNTSPQSRSSSGPRSSARGRVKVKTASPSAARVAETVGKEAKARRATGPVTWGSRLRRMFFVVAVPNLVAFFSLVVITLATVLLTTSPSAWLPTAIAQSWMVANLAPVVAGDITISALPILPALILGWLVAGNVHRAIKDKVSINDLLALLGWIIVVPLVLIVIAWFMLWDASQVYDLSPPPLGPTITRALVLHLTALVIGMGPRLWRALAKRYKVPPAVVDGVILAVKSLLALLVAAAVVLFILFIFNWDNQALVVQSYPNLAGVGLFAVIGLSVLYLPNALIAGAGVLLGSEFHIGDASLSLFSVHLVPLPPLPLLGVVPGSVSPWAIGLFALTAIAIAVMGVKRKPNFLQAIVAGVAAGVLVLIFGYLISGELGYYESVGLMLLIAAGLAVLWVAGINLAVATGLAINARRHAAPVSAVSTATASADVSGDENTHASPEDPETLDTEEDAGGSEEAEGAEGSEEAENTDGGELVDAPSEGTDSSVSEQAAHGNPDTEGTRVDTAEGDAEGDAENLDYIDGEVEEVDQGVDDTGVSQDLSDDLMDNLEDGAFPDEVPGEDDVEDRLASPGDAQVGDVTENQDDKDSEKKDPNS